MSKVHCQSLSIPGSAIINTVAIKDERGSFSRYFCVEELGEHLGHRKILQINNSVTRKVGAVRGLHFQYPPKAEMKFVRCISGRVWDVIVDFRQNSPTFLDWIATEISSENDKMLVIPEGCAHGFQVLEPNSQMLYLHTEVYCPSAVGRYRFDDPTIGIDWPLDVTAISRLDKDAEHLPLDFAGVKV